MESFLWDHEITKLCYFICNKLPFVFTFQTFNNSTKLSTTLFSACINKLGKIKRRAQQVGHFRPAFTAIMQNDNRALCFRERAHSRLQMPRPLTLCIVPVPPRRIASQIVPTSYRSARDDHNKRTKEVSTKIWKDVQRSM